MATFPAFLDTCALFGAYLCDTLLRLAEAGAYRPLWSAGVLEELERNLLERGLPEEAVTYRIREMRRSFRLPRRPSGSGRRRGVLRGCLGHPVSVAPEQDTVEGDDRQYSPTRLSGWLEFVNGPDRARPERLSAAQIAALPARELVRYNDLRAVWHANIGPIKTPQ